MIPHSSTSMVAVPPATGRSTLTVVLAEPASGVPSVVDDSPSRSAALEALRAGHGPIAIDVERAQSFRYSSKAYLLQLKRPGSGIILIDPTAFQTDEAEVALAADVMDAGRAAVDLAFVDADKLIPSTNCGMAPLPRRVALDKLGALSAGANLVRNELAGATA